MSGSRISSKHGTASELTFGITTQGIESDWFAIVKHSTAAISRELSVNPKYCVRSKLHVSTVQWNIRAAVLDHW